MLKEYKQLNDLSAFGAVDSDEIDIGEKKKALRAINITKIKNW